MRFLMTVTRLLCGALALLSAAAVSAPGYAQSDDAVVARTDARAEGGVADISFFYDALSDDGGWVDHPRYGLVWQPDVDEDWRPYTQGRWAYSDTYGWTWVSDEPFGWAIYHYGRLTLDPDYGWIWVPGTEWAPAWVLWRYNDEAIGWAPMPPETRFDRGRVYADPGTYESRRFLPRWVFASPKSFARANVGRYARPMSWNRELIGRTQARISYDWVDDRIVNRGLPPDEMERIVRSPLPRAKIAPVDDTNVRTAPPRVADKQDGDLGDVQIYRPDRARSDDVVKGNPQPKQAAKKPTKRPGGEYGLLPRRARDHINRDDDEKKEAARRPRDQVGDSERDAASRSTQDRDPHTDADRRVSSKGAADAQSNDTPNRPRRVNDGAGVDATLDLDEDEKKAAEQAARDRAKNATLAPPSGPYDAPEANGEKKSQKSREERRDEKSDDKRDAPRERATREAEPEPAPRVVSRGKDGKPVEFYQEMPDTGPAPKGKAAPAQEDYGENGPFPQPELIDEPDSPPPGSTQKSKDSTTGSASKAESRERATAAKPAPKSAVTEEPEKPVTKSSGSGTDHPAKSASKSPSSTDDIEPAHPAAKTSTGAAAKPSAKSGTATYDGEAAKPAGKSSPSSSPSSAKTGNGEPAKTSPAPVEGTDRPRRAASDATARPRSDETGSTAKDAFDETSPPKSKRRWDQNGASGYPTVVGPDGAPAQ